MNLLRAYHIYSFLVGVGLAAAAAAADPPKLPDWPTVPDVPQPMPKPADQKAATILKEDQLYIVQSDTPSILLASPQGLVTIEERKGPVVIRGRFVDAGQKALTREYTGKQVWIVEGMASGNVELLKVPIGAKTVAEVERRQVTVQMGLAPQPPPKPVDPVDPPAPTAPVIGIDGTSVLIVYESADTNKYTKEQGAILSSVKFYEYLDSVCAPHPDGKTKAWRIWDKDTSGKQDSVAFDDAMKRARKSTPWLIVSSKLGNYEGPLPANVDATIAKVAAVIAGK